MILKQLIKTTKVSKQELRNLKNLVKQSAEKDGFSIRLYWGVIANRQLPEFDDFFYYIEGKLVAYLALFEFKRNQAEVNAVVHPDYRRRGLFTRLIVEAAWELKKRGLSKVQLICHAHHELAIKLAKACGAKYDHSECEMKWTHKVTLSDLPEIELRRATEADIAVMAVMDKACFHNDKDHSTQRLQKNMQDPKRMAFVASANGVDIGKTHIRIEENNVAFIHDLGVLPEFQQKRYATAMVMALLKVLRQKGYGQVALDVLSDNTSAIKLYKRCGFELTAEHQFWQTQTAKLPSA